ncbi:MAG: type IX secretion system sortase PorU [Flavobacteriales bacterium]|nr:type IX secretion system sortase PorU [Flavobacteriales bacterium]
MKIINLLAFILLPLLMVAGEKTIERKIKWFNVIENQNIEGGTNKFFAFDGANYDEEKGYLAFYTEGFDLGSEEIVAVNIVSTDYEELVNFKGVSGLEYIDNNLNIAFFNTIHKKRNQGIIKLFPFIKNSLTGKYQKLIRFQIQITTKSKVNINQLSKKTFVQNSILANGEWYRIAVINDGVFKLTADFLEDLGLEIDNLNPQDIKLYGNGGKMLPELNADFRYDDLHQNAIYVEGESDGVFDKEDYILFYGQSPNNWKYNSATGLFNHEINRYSDTTFYYLTVSNTAEAPKRITTQNSLPSPNTFVNSFNDYAYYEKESTNLLKSGREWYGDAFDIKTSYDYSFNFPNLNTSTPVNVSVSGAARSGVSSSFSVYSGSNLFSVNFASVSIGCYSCTYAQSGINNLSFSHNSDVLNLTIEYSKPNSSSIAWLNDIEVNVRRNLSMIGSQMFFRDIASVGTGKISQFTITGASNIVKLWDVTDPINIKEQQIFGTSTIDFTVSTDVLKQFVALTSNYSTQVYAKGMVQNQNLHSLGVKDMIIISHPNFLVQADQIAEFHQNEGLRVVVVTPQQIYNEFSSGSQDIVAIRDFVRMFYERATIPEDLPKYLLLFGDGSYDNKNRLVDNTNFIPTYQSVNSLSVVGSLVSDDYYGLLDPTEGSWAGGIEYVDIGIGRFPVKSIEEANNVVYKVLNYNTSLTMKDWRNIITFIGDDEDSNTHMTQSNSLSAMVEQNDSVYNENKIFFDAFTQVATPGGNRYPDVNDAINDAFNEGSLIVNYTGHGGETGLAHERVLTVNDINNLSNQENLPLVVTATCEFSRFDDPRRTSAGELVLLNESGGIALLTTVRLVYSSPNFSLNQSFYSKVFEEVNGEMPAIGDVFMDVKNLNAANSNNRNFTLLGDPALKLAYPIHDVKTTNFKGNPVSATLDTIKALETVTIQGYVQDRNGQKLTNYNGIIYPTVFDKKKQITTLANDGGNPFVFDLQTNKLFKGKVSVQNGDFSFSFVVPKDISYNFGKGKISYYAENQEEDANGFFTQFYIGGTADNYDVDNEGPEIELYLNDNSFVFGGLTDENPILLAYVSDLHGINMVGNGIGHDIIAVLDDKTDEAFVLNDYYEADLNSYQKGTIRFPFHELEEGRHKLTLKVWDVYNNSHEVTTEFIVEKAKDIVIDRVYNYPNPFTTSTEFWFEHNQSNKQMYAQVQIFTVSGKLVKTIEKNILNEGFRSTSIKWDGLDDFGDRLARGVYVYRLRVRADNLSTAEKYQKLVIL